MDKWRFEVAAFLASLPDRVAERLLLCGLAVGVIRSTMTVTLFAALISRRPEAERAARPVEEHLREQGLKVPEDLERMEAEELTEVALALLHVFWVGVKLPPRSSPDLWLPPEETRAEVTSDEEAPDDDADFLAYLLTRLPVENAAFIDAHLALEVRERLRRAVPSRFDLGPGTLAEQVFELVKAGLLTLEQALTLLDSPLSLPSERWQQIAQHWAADFELRRKQDQEVFRPSRLSQN